MKEKAKKSEHYKEALKKAEEAMAAAKKHAEALKKSLNEKKEKWEDALQKAKETAVDVKDDAIAKGADSRLFLLEPDEDEIAAKPRANGAIYYCGLTSLVIVSGAVIAITVRKFRGARAVSLLSIEEDIEENVAAIE